MRFRSFQIRLMVLFCGLFALVLSLTLFFVDAAGRRSARAQIDDALEIGVGVFRNLVEVRTRSLVDAARLLSGDYAFKTAYATRERATVLSALDNHRQRIGADVMILASTDYAVLADTSGSLAPGSLLPFADAIDAALDRGELESSVITPIDGTTHLMVVVPLMLPMPDAWIGVGFRLDDPFAEQLRRLALSHVSLLAVDPAGTASLFASTLPGELRPELQRRLAQGLPDTPGSAELTLGGEPFVFRLTSLQAGSSGDVRALLQRPLRRALAPYRRLQAVLVGVFLVGLGVCLALGAWIARSVSKPVLEIAAVAQLVERGDYSRKLEIRQRDEIGTLAEAFNHMVEGLEERKRVRSLLGKVVSPEVARELLRRGIALGGEEREVTVLFSDLRGFTTLCEAVAPADVVALLNDYMTRMTTAIEAHDGVVDKYVGDAVMALFGAPLRRADDATRAVRAALDMQRALAGLNEELQARGIAPLVMGIGINTATVVAGNMGSETRLNYTVIGDGVNLASRLEGLTKRYGVPVLVSEATRQAAGESFDYRELGRERVKGKTEPVTVFEVRGQT